MSDALNHKNSHQQDVPHYPTIIGIDPGLRHTGYGIIRKMRHQLQPIAWGVISSGQGTLPVRLGRIFSGLNQVIENHRPEQAAVEIVFVNVNPQSTLMLGQARGAVMASLVNNGVSVMELTALQIKQGIVGYGRATKTQIRLMVKTILNVSDDSSMPPSDLFPAMSYDAADALACAIASSFQIHQLYRGQNLSKSHSQPLSTQQAYLQQTRRRRKSSRWGSQPKRSV